MIAVLRMRLYIAVLSAVMVFGSWISIAHAESVQWNQNLTGEYSSPQGRVGNVHMHMILSNPGITVNYHTQASLVDDSGNKIQQLSSGDMVREGDRVLFEFVPHQNQDIFWYATGSSWGTPYGYWRDGASDPGGSNIIASPAPRSDAPTCNANAVDKYATQVVIEDKHYVPGCAVNGPSCATTPIGGYGDLYAAYSVASPAKSVSTSGAWSGCTDAGSGNKICTIGDSGTNAAASLIFAPTQSRFYGDMVYNFTSKNFRANDGGKPSGCIHRGNPGSGIAVPEQRIQYNFNVEGAVGGPPTTPSLTSGACIVGTPHTINFVSTDPDGDTVRYGVDWDADGSVDQFVPPSGYVPSGTSQSANRTYTTSGTKTVKVMTQDQGGLSSPWATVSFSCSQPATAQCADGVDNDGAGLMDQNDPDCSSSSDLSEFSSIPPPATPPPGLPTANLRLTVPSLIARGKTVQVTWSADNVASCNPVIGTNGDSFPHLTLGNTFYSPVGGRTSSEITKRTTYTLRCVDLNGITHTKTAVVNIAPNWKEK